MKNEELKNVVSDLRYQASLFGIATNTLAICVSQLERHSNEDDEVASDLASMLRELADGTRQFTGDAVRIAKMLRDKTSKQAAADG